VTLGAGGGGRIGETSPIVGGAFCMQILDAVFLAAVVR
jgi:hypothetical protein